MRTGLLAVTLLIWGSGSALAAPLDINTHTAAVPEQSVKLAGIYWLPDYLKDNMDSNHRTETAPAGSGDRQDLSCSTYGGCAGVPAHMSCSQTFSAKGTTCYKSCSCKSGYNRVSSADVCLGCANPCDSVTAAATPYGCQTPWSVCPSKCQVAYPDNCRNRTGVSTPYDCQTAWADCSTKCQVAYPDNCHNRTAVPTPYGCQTLWSDCSTKCQVAYPDNCRYYSSKPLASSCANGCAQGRTLSDCTSRCAVGCKARCDTGYHLSSDQLSCVADSCPSGYTAGKTCGAGYTVEKSGQSGNQVCGKCVVKACAVGSTSCSGATVAAANGYYSGDSQCYTCQSCEQAGQKTCNGSCIASSQCCGGCPTNYACKNGSCVAARTCQSEIEAKGGKLISTQSDLINKGSEGGNLYVSGAVQVSSPFTLKNVTLNNAARVSRLCTPGSLTVRGVSADGKLELNIPFTATTISTLAGSRTGFQLKTSSELTIKNINFNQGSNNLLNLSDAVSASIENITTETYNNSSILLEIFGNYTGNYYIDNSLFPNIGKITVNGYTILKLYSSLNICSVNLSNSESTLYGPNVYFQAGSNIFAQCTRSAYSPFISMYQCGSVNKKCSVYFGPANSRADSCKINFNNRSLDISSAVAVASVNGTLENVSSWGVTSANDTRFVTEFLTRINGRLQFSDGSSVSGGSICEFKLKYNRFGTSSISNSSQINSIKSGYCTVSRY